MFRWLTNDEWVYHQTWFWDQSGVQIRLWNRYIWWTQVNDWIYDMLMTWIYLGKGAGKSGKRDMSIISSMIITLIINCLES